MVLLSASLLTRHEKDLAQLAQAAPQSEVFLCLVHDGDDAV